MLFGEHMLIQLVYLMPAILISLTFHELSHGFISYKLGDPTAKYAGRLTLNPLKHLDPLGTLMLLLGKVGWAKPVPINPMYYKNRKTGTVLVSLAGPVSNILLATLASIPLLFMEWQYNYYREWLYTGWEVKTIIHNFCSMLFIVNVNLAIFNLIPVPPLDGSKILSAVLPSEQYFKMMQYENYIGVIFLIILFVFPDILWGVLNPIIGAVQNIIFAVINPLVKVIASLV